MDTTKTALLIYRDGRLHPTNTVQEQRTLRTAEFPTMPVDVKETDAMVVPMIERSFVFVGQVGPYRIYEEI